MKFTTDQIVNLVIVVACVVSLFRIASCVEAEVVITRCEQEQVKP
jgi:hypothetical protein